MTKKKNQKKPMSELDQKISDLIQKRKTLLIKNDKREITEKEFNEQMPGLQSELRTLTYQKLQEMRESKPVFGLVKEEPKTEEPKVEPERKIIKEKKPIKTVQKKPVKKPEVSQKREDTYVSLILKALQHQKLDTEEKVVSMVHYWKPALHKENIRYYTHNIISLIKTDNPRFARYAWDSDKYMVIRK
jgi:hypothetical protein